MDSEHTGPGRVVVVTGASSGIGRATAHALAERGTGLVLVARSAERLEEVRAECAARGAGPVVVRSCDVGDGDAVDAVLDDAARELGGVHGVVHAAAVLVFGRFEDVPPEVFDATVRTNLTGTANVARSALRTFRGHGGGSLVVVGSLLGKVSFPEVGAYDASKWGVHGLVRALQIETRRAPAIHVSLVAPGPVRTPIWTRAGSYTGRSGKPLPPSDSPEKVAAVIVRTLDHPRRVASVGAANPLATLAFRAAPATFDRMAGPLLHRLGQQRDRRAPGPGNVSRPT